MTNHIYHQIITFVREEPQAYSTDEQLLKLYENIILNQECRGFIERVSDNLLLNGQFTTCPTILSRKILKLLPFALFMTAAAVRVLQQA